MIDIVERLRKPNLHVAMPDYSVRSMLAEAANEIEMLRRALLKSHQHRADLRALIEELSACLASDQQPLGAEFEAVWDKNTDQLYEP